MNPKSFFVILVSLFNLIACKKDPEIEKPSRYIYLSQELKDWTYFKPGSYWIVKDSLTQQEDSFYVSSVTPSWNVQHLKDSILLYEEVRMRFYPNVFGLDYIISCYGGQYAKLYDYQGNRFFVFSNDTNALAIKNGDGILINRSVSNFTQNGIAYGNVRFMYYFYIYSGHSGPSNAILKDFIYWKKNVGVIKKDNLPGFTNGYSKQVIRYKVIQ